MATLRPMSTSEADVEAAVELTWLAMWNLIPAAMMPDEDERRGRGRARALRLLDTDPDGSWVAIDDDGETIIGIAMALVRERRWLLSQLAVHPDHHGRRLGSRLLEAALQTAEGTVGGLIVSSSHPSAMALYRRAGFTLLPALEAAGPVRHDRIPSGLRSRPAVMPADGALMDSVSRHVRGAAHGGDRDVMASVYADTLLVHDDGGWAMGSRGQPILVAATRESVARDLLWSVFRSGPRGGTVDVGPLTAAQQWAIDICLDAGLALGTTGPVCVRGELGTMSPYLPTGSFL